MDNQEQKSLFEIKKEIKIIPKEEQSKKADKQTGQLMFLTPETEVRALIREEMEPILETNRILSEKSDRLANTLEKAIPHIQNQMIGNSKEAYQVWCDDPENADIAKVNTSAPAEVVYELISSDLRVCFGCNKKNVSLLLKDLELWDDHRFVHHERITPKTYIRKFKRSILDEVHLKLADLINSEKFITLTEKRQGSRLAVFL